MPKSNLFLVDAAVLPDGLKKVVEAKRLLKTGEAKNLAEAARMTGISRSTFYKYKDHVFLYHERSGGKMITIHVMLRDQPGVLSGVLAALYEAGANILTLNQNIPISGLASVSLSIRTDKLLGEPEALISTLQNLEGVCSVEQILGDEGG